MSRHFFGHSRPPPQAAGADISYEECSQVDLSHWVNQEKGFHTSGSYSTRRGLFDPFGWTRIQNWLFPRRIDKQWGRLKFICNFEGWEKHWHTFSQNMTSDWKGYMTNETGGHDPHIQLWKQTMRSIVWQEALSVGCGENNLPRKWVWKQHSFSDGVPLAVLSPVIQQLIWH